MSMEEDDASLKELVTKTLQSNGVLGKIQAQLRASVFLALEEEFKDKNIPLVSASVKQLLATPEGVLAAALVHNFLQCLSLDFSLAVFAPESGHSTLWNFPGEDVLSSNLNLSTGNKQAGDKAPLLIELLKERTSSKSSGLEHNRDKGVLKGRSSDLSNLPQLSAPRTLQPISNTPLSGSPFGGNSHVLKNQRETNLAEFSLAKEDRNIFDGRNERQKSDETGENKDPLGTQTQEKNSLGSFSLGIETASSRNVKDDDAGKAKTDTGPTIHRKKEDIDVEGEGTYQEAGDSLTGAEKQYEEDFSSMSEKDGQDDGEDDGDDDDVEEEDEEIEEAEDIDEDISLDDLINSSASVNSDHTKDQSLSQASDAPNYQEDL